MTQWKILPGLTEYQSSLHLMNELVEKIQKGLSKETILLIEYLDTYTAGTSYKPEDIKDISGMQLFQTGRGGGVTYHGPGQRVIYPILKLSNPERKMDIKKYILDLENWIIATLKETGVEAFTIPSMIGIWTLHNGLQKKIAAIGIRISKWVTYHGISVNINNDLRKFEKIVACGIKEFGVTSLKQLGVKITLEEFDSLLKNNFHNYFI